MKQDLKLGLILTVTLALVLAPRFLPKLDFPNGVSQDQASADASDEVKPAVEATKTVAVPEKSSNETPVITPAAEEESPRSNALSTVFPDGYHDVTSKKNTPKEKPEPPKEKPAPAKTKEEVELPPLPGFGDESFFADDSKKQEKPTKSDDDLALPDVPGLLDAPEPKEALAANEQTKKPELEEVDAPPADLALPSLEPDEVTKTETANPYVPVSTTVTDAGKASNAAQKSKEDVPVRTFPVKRKVQGAKAGLGQPEKFASKPPVHPYFQRYLERKEYFVREGDTLENIALRLYQDAKLSDYLFELNRDVLSRPEDLRPGTTIKLP